LNSIIEKLENLRQTGTGRWLARCPAHDDKTPSLAVRETPDGTILLHCFSGCDVHEICAALGIELADLFPPDERQFRPRERRPFPAMDALRAIRFEARVVAVAAGYIARGEPLTDADAARVLLASERIDNAVDMAEGKR